MNYKNSYPRKDMFSRNFNTNQHKRKSEFNFSDNENDDLKIPESKIRLPNLSKNFTITKNSEKRDFLVPNISIMKKGLVYTNIQDKFNLLEKLDSFEEIKEKNLRLDRPMIAGTCQDMCPEKERYSREYKNFISVFEKNGKTFDSRKAIKEYDRCVADQKESLPHNLRPTEVLQRTMNYLLTEIVDLYDENVLRGQWYTFLWNRTRSIKKDITQQNLCNEVIVNIIEQITRFHIFCSAWLCEDPKDVFEPKLNEENLKNCLQTLKDLYSDLPPDSCANEPEFRSYMMILNLDKGEMLDEAQKFTSCVFNSPKLTFVISIYQAILTNNYVRFFRLLEQSDLILSCLLHRFIAPMRFRAFQVYNKAYVTNKFTESKANQIPLSTIFRQLKFDNIEQALEFCKYVNQEYMGPEDNIMIVLNYSKLNFVNFPKQSKLLVQSKRGNQKLSTIFNGGKSVPDIGPELPECKMVSFDENGFYIGGRPIPQNLGPLIQVMPEQADEVITIESSEEEFNKEESPMSSGNETRTLDNFFVKVDKNNIFETKNIFQKSTSQSNCFDKINLFSNENIFSNNQRQQQELPNFSLKIVVSPDSDSSTHERSPDITKEPLFSQEELYKMSKIVWEQLASEFISNACSRVIENILTVEKLKNFEIKKVFDGLLFELIKKDVSEKAHDHNINKKIVMNSVSEDFILEIVTEQIQNVSNYIKKKKNHDKMQKFYQKKLYFTRWFINCQYLIRSRKCLSNLPAVPRMKDDFSVCQDFRGKVRKVSTGWFLMTKNDWSEHPLTSRLEQLTGGCKKSIIKSQTQTNGSQTILSYYNKSSIKLSQFIQDFVKFRFLNVLDHIIGNLEMSFKVHPAPEILISDYNDIISNMQLIIQSNSMDKINCSSCFLPVIAVNPNIQKVNKEYIDELFQNLNILPNQRKHYFVKIVEFFDDLGGNLDLVDLSYFHLRLFPWIGIIKQAVLNKLDKFLKTLPNKEIEIEKSVFSPLKLQSECIDNEISVQFCIDKCIKKEEKISSYQIKTPIRSRYFNDLCNGINQLTQKLDEFKKNL